MGFIRKLPTRTALRAEHASLPGGQARIPHTLSVSQRNPGIVSKGEASAGGTIGATGHAYGAGRIDTRGKVSRLGRPGLLGTEEPGNREPETESRKARSFSVIGFRLSITRFCLFSFSVFGLRF